MMNQPDTTGPTDPQDAQGMRKRDPRPVSDDAQESGFARVEREGFEAMEQRDPLTEDGRLITDPGQDMRAPEERPTIHQAFPEISADEAAASEGLATERREERPQ